MASEESVRALANAFVSATIDRSDMRAAALQAQHHYEETMRAFFDEVAALIAEHALDQKEQPDA